MLGDTRIRANPLGRKPTRPGKMLDRLVLEIQKASIEHVSCCHQIYLWGSPDRIDPSED